MELNTMKGICGRIKLPFQGVSISIFNPPGVAHGLK